MRRGRAAAPDRKLFAHAVADTLAASESAAHGSGTAAKSFLLTQLRLTAGDDEVAKIAPLLTDNALADDAAQALISINTPSVAPAIRAALPNAKDSAKVTVIAALGNLRDSAAAPEILKSVADADPAIQNAALHALANIGDEAVAPALAKAANADEWHNRSQGVQATLLLARRLAEAGKKNESAALLRELIKTRDSDKERHIQCAALNILTSALGEEAFDDLKTALKSASPDVKATALQLASNLPGPGITARWVRGTHRQRRSENAR